jgi:hypothetical protein
MQESYTTARRETVKYGIGNTITVLARTNSNLPDQTRLYRVDDLMTNAYGAVNGMRIGGGTKVHKYFVIQ